MSAIKTTAGLILLISCTAAIGQEYRIGFKIISTCDSSRIYKPNSAISDKLHYRAVDIDLWYPAEVAPSDTTASFPDLAYLLEQRSNFYDDTKNHTGLTGELLQYISAGLNTDHDSLKKVKTNSYVNAKPIEKRFPLVVYLAGLNGMSYENYLLFESLVKNGFAVASVSSIGRYPGNMTMDFEDLAEQIKDAEIIINKLKKENFISGDVGLIGYSWGGLAASIMAMREPHSIKAVVSLDGSEQFTYVDDDESKSLTAIREANFFKPELITSSFLYLDSDVAEWENLPDSIYNITDFISGDKCYLKVNHSTHGDFSGLAILTRQHQTAAAHYVIQQLTINYLRDKLKGEDVFYRNIPGAKVTRQFTQSTLVVDSKTTNKRILKGVIRDKKSNIPLPYVNIGVVNKDNGTTSNRKGKFELDLVESNRNDTLRISMIGYESKIISLKDFFEKQKSILTIQLQEKANELKEIVIMDRQLTTKVLGNTSTSKFFGGKFASGDLGSEIAIRIKIKDTPTYLNTFSFNISYNRGEAATFRVNIYDVKDGLPGKNILTAPVIQRINDQTGEIDIDLSKYNVVVSEDFFIALEWIEGENNSGVVFSAGFVNKGTYYRKASQGRWKKYPMGVGFNVTTKY